MEVIISFAILIAFLGTAYPMRDIPKNNVALYSNQKGVEAISLNYRVKSYDDIKHKKIVKQEYDYSCGSAALAMLLDNYLGEELTEQQVIQGMMQYGDADKIQKRRAFSLLDMKRFVEVLGYKAGGYTGEFNDLKNLNKPAIIPIEFYGYKHFVVFRGIYGGHIFVADPNMGNMSYTIDKFKEIWTQPIIFVVSDEDIKTNSLKLTNEDLQYYDFDMSKPDVFKNVPDQYITQERQLRESTGEAIRSLKY